MRDEQKTRLFVALELPEDVRSLLAGLQTGLPGMRWAAKDNLHLTIRFIGDVPSSGIPSISDSLDEVRAFGFSLKMRGLGAFEQSRQTVLWTGLEPCAGLEELRNLVDAALRGRAGLELDSGPFRPHITLGRLKASAGIDPRDFINEYAAKVSGGFKVESFALFRSRLTPEGAVHVRERLYPLA